MNKELKKLLKKYYKVFSSNKYTDDEAKRLRKIEKYASKIEAYSVDELRLTVRKMIKKEIGSFLFIVWLETVELLGEI